MIVFFLGVSTGVFVVLILQAGGAYRAKHCRVAGNVTVAELIARDEPAGRHTLKFEAVDSFGATEQYGETLAMWNAEMETDRFLIPMHVDRR